MDEAGKKFTLNPSQAYLDRVARITRDIQQSAPEFAEKFLGKVRHDLGLETLAGVNYHFGFSYSGDDQNGEVYFGITVDGPAVEDTNSQTPGFAPTPGMFNYGGFSYKVGTRVNSTFMPAAAMLGTPLTTEERELLTRLQQM